MVADGFFLIIGKSRGIAAFWENGFVMMRATTLMVLNAVALVHSVVDLQLSAKAPSSKTIVLCVHVDCSSSCCCSVSEEAQESESTINSFI